MKHKPLAALAFLAFVVVVVLMAPVAHARTLTFDDVPPGTDLRFSPLYRDVYRVNFYGGFAASNHAESGWGLPRSGPNVLIWAGDLSYAYGLVTFGYSTPLYAERDAVASVGAFFSTQMGVMLQVTAYCSSPEPGVLQPVASAMIGATDQSWTNHYVGVASADSSFWMLKFEGVNSPNDLLGFCLDDMTITYVPEPSSVAALCAGIGAMGAVIRRRRG